MSFTSKSRITLCDVAVAAIGAAMLVALLLPQLQRQREQARRQTCTDHLRQMALAAHYYAYCHSSQLPGAASLHRTDSHGFRYRGWGWHASLLPYLGERSVYNAINWSFAPGQGPENRTAVRDRVNVFLCPADRGGRNSYAVNAGTWYDYDYAVVGRGRWDGLTTHHLLSTGRWDRRKGRFRRKGEGFAAPSLYQSDGNDATVLFTEQVHSPSVSGLGPAPFQRLWETGVELRNTRTDQARDRCLSPLSEATLNAMTSVGEHWAVAYPSQSTWVNGLMPPNSRNCTGNYPGSRHAKDSAFGLRCASSWHKGGVNVAFLSGRVVFIEEEIEPFEYQMMFSVDRGEVIGGTEERRGYGY